MSIRVDLAELAGTMAGFGPGYLLTVGDGAQVKAVTVSPQVEGDGLRVSGPGRGSLANATQRPAVTLLFPPREPRGHSLLVDGTAAVTGEDVVVTPVSAVLHRPADHAPAGAAGGECGHDCTPVGEA